MKRIYERSVDVPEPINDVVNWCSESLPDSNFRRDKHGRWRMSAWRGDSHYSAVRSVNWRMDRPWWRRGIGEKRGMTWPELMGRLSGDRGPIEINT